MSKPWAIEGTELVFRDEDGLKWAYPGNVFNVVSLTGNVGIIGGFFYYEDEEEDTRWIPRDGGDVVDMRPGRVWIEDSKLVFVDEEQRKWVSNSPNQPYLKE